MKKNLIILLTIITLLPFSSCGQSETNNEIIIKEKKYDISVGRDYHTNTNSGEKKQFRTDQKEMMTYKYNFVSFHNNNDLNISSSDLGKGIRQIFANTASGTLILIQEYSSMNPSSLINLMLQELIEKQISYGYKMREKAYSKTLKDGKKLNGKRVTLSYKDEEEYWSVLAYGKKDSGLLVITKIDKENLGIDKSKIDLMWETFHIN